MRIRCKDARSIVGELKKYSKDLATKPRWLVLNKKDLLPEKEAKAKAADIVRRLRFKGPVFLISGATGDGTKELCAAVMKALEDQRRYMNQGPDQRPGQSANQALAAALARADNRLLWRAALLR